MSTIIEEDNYSNDIKLFVSASKSDDDDIDIDDDDIEDRIFIFFTVEPKLSIKTKRNVTKKMNKYTSSKTRFVFVTELGSTPSPDRGF